MGKKKKKKQNKKSSINLRPLVIYGGVFHVITYFLYDKTFYNDSIIYLSLIVGGIVGGIYFIKKLKLTDPKTYNLETSRIKLAMIGICALVILGGTLLFGNVIHGTFLGLNYLGKDSDTVTNNYQIEKIEKSRKGNRRGFRKYSTKIYFNENGTITSFRLTERYNSEVDYTEFKSLELTTSKGLFGYKIIESYNLKKVKTKVQP